MLSPRLGGRRAPLTPDTVAKIGSEGYAADYQADVSGDYGDHETLVWLVLDLLFNASNVRLRGEMRNRRVETAGQGDDGALDPAEPCLNGAPVTLEIPDSVGQFSQSLSGNIMKDYRVFGA